MCIIVRFVSSAGILFRKKSARTVNLIKSTA